MKNSSEKIIAEAVRVEFDEEEDKLYIVFEVIDAKSKSELKTKWVDDLEYKLVGKNLIEKVDE